MNLTHNILAGGGIPPHVIQRAVIRYTSTRHAIGFSGSVFRHQEWEEGGDETHEEWAARLAAHWQETSTPLDQQEYAYFISYRWMLGRFMIFTSAVVQLNHAYSALIAFCSAFLIAFTASLVHSYAGVRILPVVGAGWFFSGWWRAIVMTISLFTFRQVFSKQKLFLDKNCTLHSFIIMYGTIHDVC